MKGLRVLLPHPTNVPGGRASATVTITPAPTLATTPAKVPGGLLTLRQHLPPPLLTYQVVECQVAVVAASEDS